MNQILGLLIPAGALLLGGGIGFAFGAVQHAAFLKHKSMERGGTFRSGWAVMPGSMRRVAFLLMALVLVQIACPIFFESPSVQWLVSAGVVIGYGWTLLSHLRQRVASNI